MAELTKRQQEYIDGLKALTARLEENPDLIDALGFGTMFFAYVWDDAPKFARLALSLGNSDKEVDDDKYRVVSHFGPIQYRLVTYRDSICERVVVSSEEIEEEIPDPELAEAALANVPTIKTRRTVEEINWVCPPSLHELAAAK